MNGKIFHLSLLGFEISKSSGLILMFYKKFFFGHNNMKNRVLYIECGGLLPHIYDLAYGLHFLLLEQHSISVFLRLSVSIKDK